MAGLLILIIQGIMFYSWYTGDHDYLNIVTIFYILIMILLVLAAPLMTYMSHNVGKLDSKGKKALREWLNPSVTKKFYTMFIFISTIVLMILCNYVALVVFYLLTIVYVNICKSLANKNI